jgi:hypothetical protein
MGIGGALGAFCCPTTIRELKRQTATTAKTYFTLRIWVLLMIMASMTTAAGFLSICELASTTRTSGRGDKLTPEKKRESRITHPALSEINPALYQASFIPN